MPITQLDPKSALVVIDLQKGIASLPTVSPAEDVIARAAKLAGAFRERGLPVVWVRVTGRPPGRTDQKRPATPFPPDFADLVPELNRAPSDLVIEKQRLGAFIGTKLDQELKNRGVTQVVLAGISTSSGVESTARSASDLGYHVTFVTDAMTDTNADAHTHAIAVNFPKMGESGTTQDVLRLLHG